MQTKKIIDIEDGKSSDTVHLFNNKLSNSHQVKDISIDMSSAFISAAEKYFPKAKITFDKWHMKKLLFKHLENLKTHKFHYKFVNYTIQVLDTLDSFYKNKSVDEFSSQLHFLMDYAQETLGENSISNTIQKHYKGIVNYCKSKLNNGLLEGINSKIQTIKRVAKGFRNEENFKKMIFFVFNYKLPFQVKS